MHSLGVLALAMAAGMAHRPLSPPAAAAGPRTLPRNTARWSTTWQSGVSQGMQLSLGALFNEGPAQQNRLTVTRASWLRTGDSLQLYGWSTTDLRAAHTDFETGFRYRAPLRRIAHGTLTGGGGLEHWNFPSVLGGTRDLTLDSFLGWSGGEKVPISFTANGKTLLRSDLPRGTFVCVQALHTQKLGSFRGNRVSVQHGPAYVYSFGLYGRDGHRVLRYYGTASVTRGRWGVEAMFRPQLGLQPGIPDNKYWSISMSRRFGA